MSILDATGRLHDQTGKFSVRRLAETTPASLTRAQAGEAALTKAQQTALAAIDTHGYIAYNGTGRFASRGRKPDWVISRLTVDHLETLGIIRQQPEKNSDGTWTYNRYIRA